jgi:hypothetical protein
MAMSENAWMKMASCLALKGFQKVPKTILDIQKMHNKVELGSRISISYQEKLDLIVLILLILNADRQRTLFPLNIL